MIAKLQALWQEAFQETDAILDAFFSGGFSPDRYHAIYAGDTPVSALYWFDCEFQGRKIAYIYAVATLKAHQGKGLATKLMHQTHEILKNKGYDGTILVPAGKALFAFYEKFGYQAATAVERLTCEAGGEPVALVEISAEEYARLRRRLLPDGGVIQEGAALSFLSGFCKFYAGEGFVLSADLEDGFLQVQEFLGDPTLAPHILAALGAEKGRFRMPGTDSAFAMFLPLQADCPVPTYFGLALD